MIFVVLMINSNIFNLIANILKYDPIVCRGFFHSILSKSLFDQVLSTLLNAGADPNSNDAKRKTAMRFLACSEEFIPLIKFLYEAGVHLDLANCEGENMSDVLSRNDIPLNAIGVPET